MCVICISCFIYLNQYVYYVFLIKMWVYCVHIKCSLYKDVINFYCIYIYIYIYILI